MADFINLVGKNILVTGGSRGIGEGIVRSLVAEGANVIFNYATSQKEAAALVAELGPNCRAVKADFTDPKAPEGLWKTAVSWRGHIDVLVNNAGIRHAVSFDNATTEEWDEAWVQGLRVNLIATAHLSRFAALHYRTRGGGIIIGITGRIAVRGDRPDYFHDGATKGGMNSLMRGMARFLAKDNVLTYLVCAGIIQTGQVSAMIAQFGTEEMTREIPVGRIGTPEDMANIVVFLASGKARYCTGATIDVVGASFLH